MIIIFRRPSASSLHAAFWDETAQIACIFRTLFLINQRRENQGLHHLQKQLQASLKFPVTAFRSFRGSYLQSLHDAALRLLSRFWLQSVPKDEAHRGRLALLERVWYCWPLWGKSWECIDRQCQEPVSAQGTLERYSRSHLYSSYHSGTSLTTQVAATSPQFFSPNACGSCWYQARTLGWSHKQHPQKAKSLYKYIGKEGKERRLHYFSLHGSLEVFQHILGCLLDQDVVFSFPSVIDIVVAVKCAHLAVWRKSMATHHLPTLPNRLSRYPRCLGLQNRRNSVNFLQEWIVLS